MVSGRLVNILEFAKHCSIRVNLANIILYSKQNKVQTSASVGSPDERPGCIFCARTHIAQMRQAWLKWFDIRLIENDNAVQSMRRSAIVYFTFKKNWCKPAFQYTAHLLSWEAVRSSDIFSLNCRNNSQRARWGLGDGCSERTAKYVNAGKEVKKRKK